MAANYPTTLPVFYTKTNLTDIVNAQDVNVLYDEVSAIASSVGAIPTTRVNSWGNTSFVTTPFTTVAARIENVENGAYIAYNQRVNTAGGSTIVPTTDVVAVTLQAATSVTSKNLLEVKNTSGTVIAFISNTGTISANIIDGGRPSGTSGY
jgi:predicted phage gp36 major capsid-like protein